MIQVVKWLYLVALAIWVGSIIFFSFVVAPTVFRNLSAEDAAQLIRKIFSKYYLVGVLCAVAAIVCVSVLMSEGAFRKLPAVLSLFLLTAMGGVDLWMRQSVLPHMNVLRQQINAVKGAGQTVEPALEKDWKTLHRLSVKMNVAVLFCGLVLLFILLYARVI